jgi:serine/threonine protein phosphatase PrpC
MRLQAGIASDRGLVRPANEDSFLLRRGLYAVCDGMGGARGGEVASQMACLGLLALNPASAGQQDLRAAIANANQSIVQRGAGEAHLLGMGTTLTAMLVREGHLTLAHVGDSRAYLLHGGELTQLTEDHSWVGEMVRRGELTPEQAAIHPHRSVITRALGTDGEIDPDLLEIPVVQGDRILLCSDGLTGMVSDSEIAELLGRDGEPQEVAELLVKAALAGGGEDNVTVLVVDVLPDGADGEGTAAEPELGPFGGDQILFGPSDRGGHVAASSHRGRRPGVTVRERLGLSLPSLRPVGPRPDEGEREAEQPAGDGDAQAAAAAPPEEAPSQESPPPEEASAPSARPATEDDASAAAALRKRKRRLRLFLTLAVVLVLALGVAGFAIYNSTVYYVGTYDDGTVALYHGLPNDVLGIELSQAVELGAVNYDTLAPYLKARVDTHELVSKEDGQVFLRSLGPQQ